MSGSLRKNCFCGATCAESEKDDKRRANRLMRRKLKTLIDCELTPNNRDFSNVLTFAKDGKKRFVDL